MAWKMSVNGISPNFLVHDLLVNEIKKYLQPESTAAGGLWADFGDQDTEGAQQIFIPAGAVVLFTRVENDPHEAGYVADWKGPEGD